MMSVKQLKSHLGKASVRAVEDSVSADPVRNKSSTSQIHVDEPLVIDPEVNGRPSVHGPSAASPPVQQLTSVLRRRVELIATIVVTGTLLVGGLAFLIPPKYTAIAQILVGLSQGVPVAGQASVSAAPDEAAIETQVAMINSREHLERVIASFARRAGEGDVGGATAGAERDDAAASSAPPEKNTGPSDTVGELALEDLERNLRVNQERSSRVISVSFTATNPKKAATVANRVVQLYIDAQGEQKRTLAKIELARLDARIADLKREMEQASAEMQKLLQQRTAGQSGEDARATEARLRELEGDVRSRSQLYTNLLQRQKEISYQEETVVPDTRILSLASLPHKPSSSSPFLFVMPASIIFLMCGCWVAFLVDRLDQGLRGERDVSEALGISCLGLVSRLSQAGRSRPGKYFLKHPFGAYAESIRAIAASLQLSVPSAGSRVVLTSSSLPGEGKTTLAVSLAIYVALLRRRVILIDLDFRRPAVLRMLRSKARRGVADLLVHDLPLQDVVRSVPHINLDYLPMTPCSVDPVSFFSDGRLPLLLQRLRRDYDCIIIDGPPLIGVTEARLLAPLVDKVLLVVKWASTRKEIAESAVKLLRDAGCFDRGSAHDPSAVLTQVDLKEQARYGYGDFGEYISNYASYYPKSLKSYTHSVAMPRAPSRLAAGPESSEQEESARL